MVRARCVVVEWLEEISRQYALVADERREVQIRNDGIDGKTIDIEQFRELLGDEFNLPEDFDLVVDIHWDLGHGWSEEFL